MEGPFEPGDHAPKVGNPSGPADPTTPQRRMVIFRAAGERFAVPLESVREVVVPQPPFARVPRAGAAVSGAMNLRGRVVVLVELAPLLGLRSDGLDPTQGHALVLDKHRRGLALLVGAVLGVELLPLPDMPEPRDPSAPTIGTVASKAGAVTLLDPDALEAKAVTLFHGG